MTAPGNESSHMRLKVAIVAPSLRYVGGQAVQADLLMRFSKSERGKFIKPDVPAAQKNRGRGRICIAREQNGVA